MQTRTTTPDPRLQRGSLLAPRTGRARFSSASAIWLAAAIAAVLPSVYGAPEERGRSLIAEVVFAAVASGAALSIVPFTLAIERRRVVILRFGVALLSVAAGAIHFAVIGEHFDEYWLFGVGFVSMGLAQLAWAPFVLTRPMHPLLALGIVLNLGIIGLWIWTRTLGLPFGPDAGMAEKVGLADALSVGFEALIVLGAGLLLAGKKVDLRLSPRRGEVLTWFAILLLVGVTTLGLLSAAGIAAGVLPPAA